MNEAATWLIIAICIAAVLVSQAVFSTSNEFSITTPECSITITGFYSDSTLDVDRLKKLCEDLK